MTSHRNRSSTFDNGAPIGLPGLFISGVDTDVGKTYTACLIVRFLRQAGLKVGVYKPAASGCQTVDGRLQSGDAWALWEAAGRPLTLHHVCPFLFSAPLSPPRAARQAGTTLPPHKLRDGLDVWLPSSDVLVVEGAGGLLSPLADGADSADFAVACGFPLVVSAVNRLGMLNHTLLTLEAAEARRLRVACVVVNEPTPAARDPSAATNLDDLRQLRPDVPILSLAWNGHAVQPAFDWTSIVGAAGVGGCITGD